MPNTDSRPTARYRLAGGSEFILSIDHGTIPDRSITFSRYGRIDTADFVRVERTCQCGVCWGVMSR